jgi:hypothetical protein
MIRGLRRPADLKHLVVIRNVRRIHWTKVPLPHRNGASGGEFRDGDRGVARIHYCLSCSWECERHEDGSARAREWVDTTYDTWSRIFAVCAGCATLRCARLISSSAVLRMEIELASTVLGGRRGRLAGGSVSPAQAAFSSSLPASGRTTGKEPAFGPPWGHQICIERSAGSRSATRSSMRPQPWNE